jgi:PEP-CTERM motif-containing protein
VRLAFLRLPQLLAHRVVIPCILASIAFLTPTPAAALSIGSEFVTGTESTPAYTVGGTTYGPFELNFSYVRSFDGTRVAKDVQINFVFDAALGYNAAQQAAYRATVEANAEGIWNNKYLIVDTATNSVFPVVVDLTTSGPRFDQSVAVHPGLGPTNALNWFVTNTAQVNAHEFGHLLGLYDEYIGGGIDRFPNPTLSDTGLMGLGALLETPEMLPRYYDEYLGYISTLNPDHTFRLDPVPEPSTIILVSLGSGITLLVRGWHGRHRR